MAETDLQKQCLKYVKGLQNKGYPIIAINQHGSAFSSRGVPDILMCIKGMFLAVELKVGDKKPTPLQSDYLKRIRNAGGIALVVNDFKSFQEVVNYALY